jgi:hypothetical protein
LILEVDSEHSVEGPRRETQPPPWPESFEPSPSHEDTKLNTKKKKKKKKMHDFISSRLGGFVFGMDIRTKGGLQSISTATSAEREMLLAGSLEFT